MLSYQQWDMIADAYIPLLIVLSLFQLIKAQTGKTELPTGKSIVFLLLAIAWIYGLMFLDQLLNIWPSVKLDYSTHSALALVLIYFLAVIHWHQDRKKRYTVWGSFMLYALLMIYQSYHTLLDIISTAMIVLPGLVYLQMKTGIINSLWPEKAPDS